MKSVGELKYQILDTATVIESESYSQFKEVYNFWKKTWKNIFTKVGSPEAFSADDFIRQDFIPVITHNDQIVAAHFYNVFDLRHPAVYDSKYFSIFPDEAIAWILNNDIKTVMSMEFLTTSHEWRKRELGFSLAEVLVSLGYNLMLEKQLDVSIGVAVKAAKVDVMADRLNFEVLAHGVKRGNLFCDIVGRTKHRVAPHPEAHVQTIIDELWHNRTYSDQDSTYQKSA